MSAPVARKSCRTMLFLFRHHFHQTYRCYASVKEILSHDVGQDIKVTSEGWLTSCRKQKHVTFFNINDGSCQQGLQVVAATKDCHSDLGLHCSVRVEGDLVKSKGAGQTVEVQAKTVQLLGPCDLQAYPFKPRQKYTANNVREQLHLRPRTDNFAALLKVRNAATMAVHRFFQENDYLFVHTPIITSNDCEGAGETFNVHSSRQVEVETEESGSESDGPHTAPRQSESDGPHTVPRQSESDGPHTVPRQSESDGPHTAPRQSESDGPHTVPRQSESDGPHTAPRQSESDGPHTAPRQSESDGPHTAPRQSESDGPHTAPRQSESDGPHTAPRQSESDGPHTAPRQSDRFFSSPAVLTVSGQLHLEAVTGKFLKAYNFGPTFRAENAVGRHHLSEFYMIEAEVAFIESLDPLLQVMEGLVKSVTQDVVSQCAEHIEVMRKTGSSDTSDIIRSIVDKKFERMTYTEAIEILERRNDQFTFQVSWGCDLQKEHEKYLVQHCGNVPVFVTDFPAAIKPFYARENPDNRTVGAVDLLAPEVGELVGGSLREERLGVLQPRMEQLGITSSLNWYLDLRRFGSVPHGGFGLGFERLLQCILGVPNIKDTIPFPRWSQHCDM